MIGRRVLLVLAVSVGSAVLTSTSAWAAGPKVPAGCSFDQSAGILSCTTTSTTTSQLGPETSDGQFVPASTLFDGVTGAQICDAAFAGIFSGIPASIEMSGSTYLDVAVTVTTTTQRYGLHGRTFATSTVTSSTFTGIVAGSMGCAWN